jgi:hypothetical protein
MKNRKTTRKKGKKGTRRNYKGGWQWMMGKNDDMKTDEICPICLQEIITGDNIYTHNPVIDSGRVKFNGCKRKFHMLCIKTWCDGKGSCPCPWCKNEIKQYIYITLIPLDIPKLSSTGYDVSSLDEF